MRRSRRYTWMMSGWTNSVFLPEQGGGTEVVTIGVPDDFIAVRAGFANIHATPWKIRKVIACASSCWHDYFNPLEDTRKPRNADAWSILTFQNGGLDRASVVTAADAPTEINVAGNVLDPVSGEASNARWTFTDWVPCVSAGADPDTGMRVLMLRAQVPSNQLVTFSNGRLNEFGTTPSINRGYRYFTGALKHDTDLVTHPAAYALPGMNSETLDANHLVNGQMICFVQVLTRNAGVVGLVTGDSHHAGTGTSSGLHFTAQSLFGIGETTIGTVPMGVVTVASGGLTSQQFFPRMTALLDAVRPGFVVLPCWSFNEKEGEVHATAAAEDVLFARMLAAAGQVRASGALPVFVTPFPRDHAQMNPAVLEVWLARREALRAMAAAGECVFDATPLLGLMRDGKFTGTYLDGLSSDTIHPNDRGHAILARALAPFIQSIAGIDPSRPLPFMSEALPGDQSPADDESLAAFLARLRWHEG